jgi:uncharacterized protein YndB with AHSA1/START domain
VSDAAVKAATGNTWDEWFAILDAAGAAGMSHKQIVAVLREQHSVPDWWTQMVTVQYEQERGLRQKHEKPEGFQVSANRTMAAPVAAAFGAWTDEATRRRWLPDPGFTIRKATPEKSLRITWVDGRTSVEALFYAKGEAKTQVSVQHSNLPDAAAAEAMKAYWGEALDRLKAVLQESS